MIAQAAKIRVAAAVNEHETLLRCLARSPDIVSGTLELATYEGHASAGAAYNAALDAAGDAEYVIFAHQDVYLPNGSCAQVVAEIGRLSAMCPDWAVAGVIGGDAARNLVGETWCSGHGRTLGARIQHPQQVETLDEMLLILRVASGLRFDEALPGFHLYGADIILAARAAGLSTWVIDVAAIHHSRPVISLSGAYLRAYRHMQRKWQHELPVFNLVCPLERHMWRYWITEARLRWRYRRLADRPEPQGDPVAIARKIGYEGLRATT